MRLFSAKALTGVYFVGRFAASDKRAALSITDGIGGFDRLEDAERVVENTEPEGAESYLIVQVVGEYRPRHTLLQVVPVDGAARKAADSRPRQDPTQTR